MRKKVCYIGVAMLATIAATIAGDGTEANGIEETTLSISEIVQMQEETPTEEVFVNQVRSFDWDDEEAEILLRIAMAEAESEGVKGKALVMLVVLNRVWSEEFPNSIEEVVLQKNQFSTVADGGRYYTTDPDSECYEALRLVESGWDESMGALYFESSSGDSWHSRNLELLFQHGNHKFYR